jgi:type IV pilus assembly protein PilC
MDELENLQATKSKIKSAMTYPSMVLGFAAIAVVVLLIKVIPAMVAMFPSKDMLPSITLRVLAASEFVQSYWYLMIIYVFTIVTSYKLLYRFILPFKMLIDKLMITW